MNLIKDCITFFQAGGVFMYPLAACSVLLIAAVIYRMFNMKKSLNEYDYQVSRTLSQ